jgi:hypothetical protein
LPAAVISASLPLTYLMHSLTFLISTSHCLFITVYIDCEIHQLGTKSKVHLLIYRNFQNPNTKEIWKFMHNYWLGQIDIDLTIFEGTKLLIFLIGTQFLQGIHKSSTK